MLIMPFTLPFFTWRNSWMQKYKVFFFNQLLECLLPSLYSRGGGYKQGGSAKVNKLLNIEEGINMERVQKL